MITRKLAAAVYAAVVATVVALCGCAGTYDSTTEQPMTVAPRGDNPNLPNPVTPGAANESAPQPRPEQTNTTGMGGSAR
jgi:hypothetical protein